MATDAKSRASDHGAGEETAGDGQPPHEKFHRDGSLWGRGHLVNGAMHGHWEFFRKDGTLMRSGAFDRDGQVGEWITYDKAGDPSKVTQFGS
jgi:antitoxin component YwqK of YwqJK toxin-antitoxin module